MRAWIKKNLLKVNLISGLLLILLILSSVTAGMEISNPGDGSKGQDLSTQINDELELSKPMKRQSRNMMPVFPKDHPMNDYSDVLLVVNDNSTISKQIGDYFRANRNIPDINVCNISVSNQEAITRAEFNVLRAQIENYLNSNNLTNKTNFIITTKGVPIRITHSTASRRASVDSELCLILGSYSTFIDDSLNTKISQHIYYNKDEDFKREKFPIYLVTRLTGFNFSDVKQLIDNAAASAGVRGGFFFDRDPTKTQAAYRPGNNRMTAAHDILNAKGYTTTLDNTQTFHTELSNLAGYCSWGRYDSRYYYTPVQNSGLNQPNDEGEPTPTSWFYVNTHSSPKISRNVTVNRSARFSVKIEHTLNHSGYTSLSQNVTIKAGIKYYLTGYVNLDSVANYDSGGAYLEIRAYDGTNNLVDYLKGSRRYGDSGTSFWAMYTVPYEPIPGVTKLTVSANFSKASGIVYFDDISLYEIKPKNTYVPGAIAEVYDYYTAYTITPFGRYPFTVGEFISDGVTGIKGYVDYPGELYINFVAHPDILFDRYTDGYTLAESFYMASPYMSWVDVVIGDPKTAPYFNAMPDAAVTVQNITFSKNNINQGESVLINATIENRGGSSMINLKVGFKLGDELETAQTLITDNIPQIPPANTRIVNYKLNTSEINGTQTIWVYADNLNEYREKNETNNYNSNQLVINSYPYGTRLKVSSEEIYRGNSVEIFVNVSDKETAENELNCSIFFNHTSINSWTLFTDTIYKTDHWQTQFVTNKDTETGWYDIRIIVTDQNNATIKLTEKHVFQVLNNPPVLADLEISKSKIYRTENLTINFTAFDLENTISTDMLNVSIWNSSLYDDWIILPNNFTKLQAQDLWQFSYTSSKTIKPGMYYLRVSVVDNDNEETTLTQTRAFEIYNNPPVIERLLLDPLSILRRDYTTIFIYGSDIETERKNMVVEIQYKLDFEAIAWSDLADPTVKNTHWEAVFYSNTKTLSGNYSFRARLKDENGVWTKYLYSETDLKVLNNLPIAAHNFEVEIYEATEDEEITFDALKSTDIEDGVPTTFLWDFADGTSSQEATIKHSYSKAGDYIVNLTVTDSNLGSNSTTIKIKIYNVPPIAIAEVDKIQAKVNEPISFDGSKSSDTKSDALNLTYFWDFNDGTNSTLAKVNHTFNTSGTYSVSFMVMDDDRVSDLTSMFITIEPISVTTKDNADENWLSDFNFVIILILLIIVILIIIGTLIWVFRKGLAKEAGAEEGRAKPEVSEKGVETVEADIVDVPEHVAEKGVKAGKTVKPLPTTSKLDKTKAPTLAELEKVPELPATGTIGTAPEPGKEGEEVIVPEVEVEFVPELKAPSTAPLDTAELLDTIELPHDEEESELPEDLAVSLPDITDKGLEDSDEEFVPPKIDIPVPSDQIIQPELEEEIVEAKKRGEGISFDFKRPEHKKKKK